MHWIARHILKRLAFSDSQRYNDLKPDDVEGNLFQYHARSLEKQGLIHRDETGYRLTATGQTFVADLSQTKLMHTRRLPRPVVMVVCQNPHGEYLLFRWKRQPYRRFVSLPFGRQILGQSVRDMAAEQLFFKTGYEASLSYLGHVDIIIKATNSPTDHLSVGVFGGENLKKISEPDGLTGKVLWSHLRDIPEAQTVAGLREIVAWVENPQRDPLLEIIVSQS